MIPDVQKVINHSGNVSADIFNTRLIKPPTSVLVFPLKVRGDWGCAAGGVCGGSQHAVPQGRELHHVGQHVQYPLALTALE